MQPAAINFFIDLHGFCFTIQTTLFITYHYLGISVAEAIKKSEKTVYFCSLRLTETDRLHPASGA